MPHENNLLNLLTQSYTVLDAETTTWGKGHPFDPRNRLISYAYLPAGNPCTFRYFSDPTFKTPIPATCLVGFNFKFDLHWCSELLDLSSSIWDCQLAEFIYTGQKEAFASLNECLEKYGLETKKDLVKELWDAGYQTDEIPINILEEYNKWDVQQTEALFKVQMELLSDDQKRLVLLLGEDLKVLAHMERAGVVFDNEGALQKLSSTKAVVKECEESLKAFLPEINHATFNWDSGDQLSAFLYGGTLVFDYAVPEEAVYKSGVKKGQRYTKNSWFTETVVFPRRFKPLENTEVKKTKDADPSANHFYQTDEPTLKQLSARSKEDKRIIELLLQRGVQNKVAEMFQGLFDKFEEKQWQDNLVHASFNQNVARTGRLSSSGPNMQNTPPELDEFLVSRYD
jgi:DNA polymerase I-like protein with 3'-5' exonuclease and polymerase domains